MSSTVDIFVKSCAKDAMFLKYLVRSIARYASGFRALRIVTDPDHAVVLPPEVDLELPATVIHVPLPADDGHHAHGVGYDWQQAIKLSWPAYTDADAVAIMDSDWLLTGPVTPATFHAGARPVWWRRSWLEAGSGILHKRTLDHFLRRPSRYDYMAGPCFYLTRSATLALECFCRRSWYQTLADYCMSAEHPAPSEFEFFGAFVGEVEDHGYELLPAPASWPIRQFWSWGGVTEPVAHEMEQLLR